MKRNGGSTWSGIYTIWTWSHFFFGLTYAIVASLLFLFIILFLFKPKIKISPVISYCIPEFDNDNYYVFKFINRSFFSAHDISVELYLVQSYASPPSGKTNYRYTNLGLEVGVISHLPARPIFYDKSATHAIRFKSRAEILDILKDPANSVEIRIKLKHGLSGLSKVFGYQYCDVSEIKKGKFAHGNSFDIL